MGKTGRAPGAVEVIEEAQDAADGKRVSIGEILDAVGYRSYGPIQKQDGLFLALGTAAAPPPAVALLTVL